MRIKLFEEFGEWDRDVFLLDLFTMTSTEVENLFIEEIEEANPNLEKIEVMLDSGLVDVRAKNKNGRTPLHWAIVKNSIELAVFLLDRGADVNAKDNDGWSPLHYVSINNQIEIAKLLIDRGADVGAKVDGWTPLHLAAWNNHIEMTEFLIERGADVEAKDDGGKIPLDMARSDEMRALLRGN